MTKPEILVFGANPAWQKTLYFSAFTPGAVNRAAKLDAYAAGKGVNFCRAVHCHNQCTPQLFQFAGGGNKQKLEANLRAEKIVFHTIETRAETRCCITCLDHATGSMTELIEPSQPPSDSEIAAMLTAFETALPGAAGVAITGSLPDGTKPTLYCEIAGRVRRRGIPLLIDAVTGIEPALETIEEFILKINRQELLQLTGETEMRSALNRAQNRWPRGMFAVTDGASCAWLATPESLTRYQLSELKHIISPLGAGDSCSAVLLSELLRGHSPIEAFQTALAAAEANCLTPKAGEFSPAERERLHRQIQTQKLK